MSNIVGKDTYEAWADIVMDIWRERMIKYKVRDTGALFSSLVNHVKTQANGSADRIDFFFNYYGIFVDIGVGPQFSGSAISGLGTGGQRKAKPWFSRAFYAQVKRLSEILKEKYGEEASRRIVGFLSDSNERNVNLNTGSLADGGSQMKVGFKLKNNTLTK